MVLNLNMLCGSSRKSSSSATTTTTNNKSKRKVDWRIKRKTDPNPKGESIVDSVQVYSSQ